MYLFLILLVDPLFSCDIVALYIYFAYVPLSSPKGFMCAVWLYGSVNGTSKLHVLSNMREVVDFHARVLIVRARYLLNTYPSRHPASGSTIVLGFKWFGASPSSRTAPPRAHRGGSCNCGNSTSNPTATPTLPFGPY
jgi:hypothetical protein